MTEQQLLDKRANVWSQMKDLNLRAQSENRNLNADELSQWDGWEGEIKSINQQVAQKRSADKLGAEFDAPPTPPSLRSRMSDPGPEDGDDEDAKDAAEEKRYGKAFSAYLRGGLSGVEPEHRAALMARHITSKELRAQGVGTTTAGGYGVAAVFRDRIIERMKFFGSVRSEAEVISTDTGAQLPWPTNDATAQVGAILAENTQDTELDVVLGQATLDVYMYTSKIVRVSLQLLQDSAFDFESFLQRKFGERLGRITNQHYTTGTGTAQPQGVVTGAGVGVTGATGTTATVTFNSLVSLAHSVDPAYRNGNSVFMMNDATLAAIRILRDDSGGAGVGRPLWEPSITAGVPDSLLGYRVVPNNDMATMAANARSILFGDLKAGYVIRDVLSIQSLRMDERYADFLQVGFLSFLRTGGIVQDVNAIKVYVNSAT